MDSLTDEASSTDHRAVISAGALACLGELEDRNHLIGLETFDSQGNPSVLGDEDEFASKKLLPELMKADTTTFSAAADVEVVRLHPGSAPGSEHWTHSEKVSLINQWQTRVVFNVVHPTLTVFRPVKTNGAAVVICPGGAFFGLSIDSEGHQVARWLADRGVTCFVLKYRLVECKTEDPTRELMTRGNLDDIVAPVVKLAMADGRDAIGHVRKHAKAYGVKPDRIGILGFSAGGTVAASVACNYTPETRPDFVAPIYLEYQWTLKSNGVPADAPPIFILAATDDPLGLAPHSVSIYQDWVAAKKSAELHLYAEGGHGFGMRTQNMPSDRWMERFADWLEASGFLAP